MPAVGYPYHCDCGYPLKLTDFSCPECDSSPQRELAQTVAVAEAELREAEPEERIVCTHCGTENFRSTLDNRNGECIRCGLEAEDTDD